MGTTIILGFYLIYKDKGLEIKLDSINISLISLIFISFASNYLVGDTFKMSFNINKDITRDILIFLILRNINITFKEFKIYILTPLLISFLIVFCKGIIETYILNTSKTGRFRMMGPVNKSVIYMLFIFSISSGILFIKNINKRFFYFSLFTSTIAVLGVILGSSRNGWLVLGILLLYLFIYSKFDKKLILYSIIIVIIFIITTYVITPNLLINKFHINVPYRFLIWEAGLNHYIERGRFLFGIGSDNFILVDLSKNIPNWLNNIRQMHNSFIQILVENGILGLTSISIFIIMAFKNLYKNKTNPLSLIGNLTLITFLLSSISQNVILREFGMIFFIIMSLSLNKYLKNNILEKGH